MEAPRLIMVDKKIQENGCEMQMKHGTIGFVMGMILT
jgi:hypothetical protein